MKKILLILLVFNIKIAYVNSIEPDVFVQSTVNRASQTLSKNISKEEKIKELKNIAKESVNLDEVWIHFSGHGSYVKDDNNDETDGNDEMILPMDFKTSGNITDDELRLQLNNMKCMVYITMDCCHSGTNVNLPYQLIDNKETEITTKNNALLANVIKISGCQDAQTSMESYQQDTQEFRGALTNAFIQNATEFKGSIFHVLCDNVRKDLQDKGFKQVPMLSFSQLGDSKLSLF